MFSDMLGEHRIQMEAGETKVIAFFFFSEGILKREGHELSALGLESGAPPLSSPSLMLKDFKEQKSAT